MPRSTVAVPASCSSSSGPDYFFPPEAIRISDDDRVNQGFRSFVAQWLVAASASTLSCGPSPTEAVRFIWLSSNRPEIVASVARESGAWRVKAAEFSDPRWIIEARQSNGYRAIVRANGDDPSTVIVGRQLLELAGVSIPVEMSRLYSRQSP